MNLLEGNTEKALHEVGVGSVLNRTPLAEEIIPRIYKQDYVYEQTAKETVTTMGEKPCQLHISQGINIYEIKHQKTTHPVSKRANEIVGLKRQI